MARTRKTAKKTTAGKISHSVNHPVRLDAFTIFAERMASPKELRKLLRQPLSTVSFHVKEMFRDDTIELVKTEPRRGAVEHFYRAKSRPEIDDDEWRGMAKGAKRGIVAAAVNMLVAELLSAVRHHKMEADDNLALIYLPTRFNTKGRVEVQAALVAAQERIEAAAKQEEFQDGDDARVRFIALCSFERAGDGIPRAILPKKERG